MFDDITKLLQLKKKHYLIRSQFLMNAGATELTLNFFL